MLRFLIGIVLAVVCLWVLLNFASIDFGAYSTISLAYIPVMLVMPLTVHFLQAELFRIALRFFGVSIVWLPSFLLTVSNTFLNLVAPMQTAAVLRALYMKRYLSVDISKFVGAMVSAQLGAWLVSGIVIGILLLSVEEFSRPLLEILSFPWRWLVYGVVLSVALIWAFQKTPYLRRLLNWLQLRQFPGFAEIIVLGSVRTLLCVCSVISMWLISVFMASELHFLSLLLITLLASMLVFMVLTPGNIGVFEMVMYFLAKTIGLDENTVLLCVIMDRFIFYSMAALISMFSAFYLKRIAH